MLLTESRVSAHFLLRDDDFESLGGGSYEFEENETTDAPTLEPEEGKGLPSYEETLERVRRERLSPEALEAKMKANGFDLERETPEALVIRDHARKFQFIVSHGMLFRKTG